MAPLNWGLGHATRCIPLISALSCHGFSPILGGDGRSLELLKKEFPNLPFYELPDTAVTYSKKGRLLKYKLLSQAPKMIQGMRREMNRVKEIHQLENLSGIISDNRFATRLEEVPSVYMTHQLNVLSGNTSFLTTSLHQKIIEKFDQCWVPDYEKEGLSGELSSRKDVAESIKYIGPLSRFKRNPSPKKWDLVIVLSGPEPQRKYLEEKLMRQLTSYKGKTLVIQGLVEETQKAEQIGHITKFNFMLHEELRDVIEAGKLIISRSGYSSIMDLENLEAKAFFIPTPGQFEQEYLAQYMAKRNIAGYAEQGSFDLTQALSEKEYQGFKHKKTSNNDLSALFDVFK